MRIDPPIDPRPKEFWPKKWVTCRLCKGEWLCSGYPAGPQTKWTDTIEPGCWELKDKAGWIWLWPKICQFCADKREGRQKKQTQMRFAQADP